MSKDWRTAITAPPYKDEEETMKDICLPSAVGKIYVRILVDIVCRVTEKIIHEEEGVLDQGGDV